jgi:hypothetical protein
MCEEVRSSEYSENMQHNLEVEMPESHKPDGSKAKKSATPDDREKPEIVRIQLDLPQRQVKELESLIELTGVATRKDFINGALSLLVWAIREKQKGRIIASVDESTDRYKEVTMPMLDYLGGK